MNIIFPEYVSRNEELLPGECFHSIKAGVDQRGVTEADLHSNEIIVSRSGKMELNNWLLM